MTPDAAASGGTMNVAPGGGAIGSAPGADGVAGRSRGRLPQKPEVEGSSPSRQESPATAADRYLHGAYHPNGHCPNGMCAEPPAPPPLMSQLAESDRVVRALEEPTTAAQQGHAIDSAEGVSCHIKVAVLDRAEPCGRPASHKVEEITDEHRHPFTAYVCCFHFGKIMGKVAEQWCADAG